jgi:hypothetical protein
MDTINAGPTENHAAAPNEFVVNVVKVNGQAAQCRIPDGATVQDIIDALPRPEFAPSVHKNHRGGLEPVLLTPGGIALEHHNKVFSMGDGLYINDGDIAVDDSTFTLVMKRNIRGAYHGWAEIDTTSKLPKIDVAKFELILDNNSVKLNDMPGYIRSSSDNNDSELDTEFEVVLKEPVTIRSTIDQKIYFRATGCRFTCATGDYSQGWWYPMEGKLIGNGPYAEKAGSFKARFQLGYRD